jgi:hypothetical protein
LGVLKEERHDVEMVTKQSFPLCLPSIFVVFLEVDRTIDEKKKFNLNL